MKASLEKNPAPMRIAASVLLVVLAVIAVLIFVGIYLIFPQDQHFNALILIGVLALVFALVAYLLESLSRDPIFQRALAWGFMGMGFAVLLLTLVFAPDPDGDVTFLTRLGGVVGVLIVLAITIVGILWRGRERASEGARRKKREAWEAQTPASAFSYSTIGTPTTPSSSSASEPPSPPASGGS